MDKSSYATGKAEPQSLFPPSDGAPRTIIRMSFKEVYDQFETYLSATSDMCSEDMAQLFQLLLLGYFSQHTPRIEELLEDAYSKWLPAWGPLEGPLGDAAFAMTAEIDRVMMRYIPQLKLTGKDAFLRRENLGERLKVQDAFMHGQDSIVVIVPTQQLEQLQHEATKIARRRNP